MVKLVKLEGSTLIEVLIAMVIIMIVFTLGIQIFNNVLYSSPSLKKIQVQQQLETFSKEVKQLGYLKQSEDMVDSIRYQFNLDSMTTPGIIHLEIIASQHGKQIGEIQFLYKSKYDEE